MHFENNGVKGPTMNKYLLSLGLVLAVVSTAQAKSVKVEKYYQQVAYSCEREVYLPATFINNGVVVIQVEGKQLVLEERPSASGTQYFEAKDVGYGLIGKGKEAFVVYGTEKKM